MWQRKLLSWYQQHKRDLPWRRTKDPYAIWVSEIMLQQTTVETVIPYYEKFLKRFPDIPTLSKADEEEVLRLWSGLGYYSRARNLHKGARIIAPTLPQNVEDLMRLPGIGRYTAGAIASIAFNQPAPILDGNVIRVLSRLFKIGKDPKTTVGQKYFWEVSRGAIMEIPPNPPFSKGGEPCKGEGGFGDFNQALMELGATVCTPESPKCPLCPLRSDCQARKEGRPEGYPRILKKTKYIDVSLTSALIEQHGTFLLLQRPSSGVMKSLWEFPTVLGSKKELLRCWPVTPVKSFPLIRHSVMNRRLKIRPWLCHPTDESLQPEGRHVWIRPEELENYPTSSMNRKILQRWLGK